LFPCGNLKRDELPSKLSRKGVSVIAVTVYQTKVHPQLEQRLNEIIFQHSGFPEVVVYFSPSGMKYTIPVLEKMEVPLQHLKVCLAF
jgi:uroporphyrinogen-III synthase